MTLLPTMSNQLDDMLFEFEQRLAQVGRKLSAEDASSLIAEDFVEFGSSGKIWSKADIIAAMSEWSPIERIVEDFRVHELSASVCLVTYKVVGVGQPFPFFSQKLYMAKQRHNMADSLPPGNERERRIQWPFVALIILRYRSRT
jgi:hypothetical protein